MVDLEVGLADLVAVRGRGRVEAAVDVVAAVHLGDDGQRLVVARAVVPADRDVVELGQVARTGDLEGTAQGEVLLFTEALRALLFGELGDDASGLGEHGLGHHDLSLRATQFGLLETGIGHGLVVLRLRNTTARAKCRETDHQEQGTHMGTSQTRTKPVCGESGPSNRMV